MAVAKKAKANENIAGRVELRIPRSGADDEPNVFISVNGKNWLIPKGKAVYVPPEVAEEYRRSEEAKERFIRVVENRRNSGE